MGAGIVPSGACPGPRNPAAIPAASVVPQGLPFVEVVINPGLGFGTGLHPTTRGTLLLLQRGAEGSLQRRPRGGLVDVGTGSGILAVAAVKLGWNPVRALDNDPVAVASACENVAINGLEGCVEVHEMDAGRAPRAWLQGATILANMTLEPVTALLRRLLEEGVRPRRLVVSGILAGSSRGATSARSPRIVVLHSVDASTMRSG